MENINRNEPCQCGSGKMYKDCCGLNAAISITHLLENEVDELQKQLIHFAFNYFGEDIEEDFEMFEEFLERDIEDEQERQFFELIHAIWFSLFDELDDGETIIEKFIASGTGKIKRPKLRRILQSWTEARTIAGKALRVEHNKLTVEDGFTGEQLETIIIGVPVSIEPGSFFMGILVPFEQYYVFFPSPFDLPHLKPEHAFSFIEDSSLAADYESPQEYLTEFFMEVLNELPMVGGMLEIDEIDWPTPIYKEVADLFKEKLETLEEPPPVIDMGIVLWFSYCQKKQPKIKNPALYAAGLHYLLSTVVPMLHPLSQKKTAQAYGVSVKSISPIVSGLETTLEQEIGGLLEIFEDDDEEILFFEEEDNVISFPNNPGATIIELPNPQIAPPKKPGRKDSPKK